MWAFSIKHAYNIYFNKTCLYIYIYIYGERERERIR